jgi:hypothetical protein
MAENYKQYGQEVMLQVLRILNSQRENLLEKGDISGSEIIENEVIPKFERLYGAFCDSEMEEKVEENENIRKALEDIMNAYALTPEFIKEQMRKRDMYKDISGAEVVKNLFNYELRELEGKKAELLEKANEILDREAELEHELRESIQEVDQMAAMEKLIPVRNEYSKISDKIMGIQNKIDILRIRVGKRWTYEIYGTIPKEEMMEIYKNLW